ncbi:MULTISPECIES: hypothetical protein [Myroides]|uniref:hypothetical protein n=1 Tax=Myroides TaxID=76831 RepID=UPI000741CCE6|nr:MULTISPECIES: hypothetical protein [Myroides]KUF45258.1 hypothetical protein AS361_06350 [Myroides marinus]MDM1092089.1 hypothetical protein [Myroides odoratimimus]
MKFIASVGLFLWTVVSMGQVEVQDCGVIVNNDKLTGKTFVSTEVVTEKDLDIYFVGGNNRSTYHKMYFNLKNESCIDSGDNIYVLFEDESRITRGNVLAFNCQGSSGFIINGKSVRESLKNKIITAIQVTTAKGSYRVELSKENAQKLMEQYQCLEKREYLSLVKNRY